MKDYYSQELRDYVEEFLELDFEKGDIYWKIGRKGGGKAGTRAGFVHTSPKGKQYWDLRVNGKHYRQHRLLYCFFHKDSFIEFQIDHIGQNSLNNAIDNLRHVTQSENQRNQKKHSTNTSGFTGVYWNKKDQKWKAEIFVDGKLKYLGYFDKKEDAIAARQAANIKYNYHENHGE